MLNEPMNVNRMIETSKKHFELIQLQKMEFEVFFSNFLCNMFSHANFNVDYGSP